MEGKSESLVHHIAVLAGGDSAEREVSLASGQQVALALALAGYELVLLDPAEIDLRFVDWPTFDACVIALHGGAGEDGRVQRRLDEFGVAYTGSGPAASRLAMSKSSAKRRFIECGVPTLPYAVVDASAERQELGDLGFPLVIKPDRQGSSLGAGIARKPADLPSRLQHAARYDNRIIAERYVRGREFTVSLLGRDPLPMIEVIAPKDLFSFEAKYSSNDTDFRFESNLPPPIEAGIYRASVAAAQALGTAGLARVDLMLDDENRVWVLEVNTIPGMTAHSLAPRSALAAGITMPSLADWMVRDAIHRQHSNLSGAKAYDSCLEALSGARK